MPTPWPSAVAVEGGCRTTRHTAYGATTQPLMSLYGCDSIKQAETHTKRANRRRLARSSIHLVALPGNDRGPKVSHQNGESVSHREKDK